MWQGWKIGQHCVIFIPLLLFTASAEGACFGYGSRSSVTGTLTRQLFPGPPNYESIARGDTPEIYYVVKLQKPACITGKKSIGF